MTNEEAIKYLIQPVATSTVPSNEFVKQMTAWSMAVRALNRELKHGKWIDTTGVVGWPKWNCSICGGVGRGDYKICPWCGARMDGGEDD